MFFGGQPLKNELKTGKTEKHIPDFDKNKLYHTVAVTAGSPSVRP